MFLLLWCIYAIHYIIYKKVYQASERFFGRVTITRIIVIVSQLFVVSYSGTHLDQSEQINLLTDFYSFSSKQKCVFAVIEHCAFLS